MENVLEKLTAEHREVKSLFKSIEESGEPREWQRYFAKIAEELTLHAASEEHGFYPAVRNHADTANLVDRSYEEHNEIKRLINDISLLQPTDAAYQPNLRLLYNAVEEHVKEEEDELFPRVREHMNLEQLDKLSGQVKAARSEARSKLLGMAP